MNLWSKPKHPVPFELSEKDLSLLKKIGLQLHPALRIGFKEKVSTQVVAKSNAHLASDQIIKVEFIKLTGKEIRACSKELAEKTASRLLGIHGNFVVLFRKHPGVSLNDIYNKSPF